jgi:MFS transporter, CP family, cyanate transporter
MDRRRALSPTQLPLLIAVLAAAAALRPGLTGVGPLLDQIRRDLHISHGVAGLLSTIPVACMGVFALAARRLIGAFGTRRVMTTSLALLTLGSVARAAIPGVVGLMLLTVAFGIGAGVAGALVPALVKEHFAVRSTFVTGLCAIAINGAAAVAAATAVPLASAGGGWQWALVAFGAWDLLLTSLWVLLSAPSRVRWATHQSRTHLRLPWGRGDVWTLAVVFGLQGTVYYGLNAWLASAVREHGWNASSAGALVAVLNFVTLPATLLVAAVAGRVLSKQRYLVIAALVLLLATLGIAAVPAAAVVWAALAGAALGSIFPLCMALAVDLGRDPAEVTGVSGIMLGFGYSFAALAPIALGEARDTSGSFSAGMWMLSALTVVLVAVCAGFAKARASRPYPNPTDALVTPAPPTRRRRR